MSGAPKRSHEEVTHSTSSKGANEDSGTYLKHSPAVTNEYQSSFEMGQDARMAKVSRSVTPDMDRRSPLHSVYKLPTAAEIRAYYRDKDGRDHRVENQDSKTETREAYNEGKIDSQTAKVEKDIRFESRGVDTKPMKFGKDAYSDLKNDSKMENDGYSAATHQLSGRDSKEYHKVKKYSESSSGNTDTWHVSRYNLHSSAEVGKEVLTAEEKDRMDAHEAVGENKADTKGDDKLKEKERKRKDAKHQEWGEREKEKFDRSNSSQVGNSSASKDTARNEWEADRWERERKDFSKDKGRQKEREKDHNKRESWNGAGKEGLKTEQDMEDGYVRTREQENPSSEQKKQKDDIWKNVDREARERRKEIDADAEVVRPEKRIKCYDKDTDDRYTGDEGATGREKEAFNYGVQQRKRMLRPRDSPQMANRDSRFRSHSQDNEGLQGKAEVSSVVYQVGECMQELVKLWKDFEAYQVEKAGESSNSSPTLEIRIPAEHVVATNRQVRGGQLWGTDIYTDDSDLVAVLMHTGYCRPTAATPPSAIQEFRATIKVLPPQDCYVSTLRNNVRSRAWGAAIGCSYCVKHCCIVKNGGGTIDLQPCLNHTSTVEPTLAPVAVERTMTTRAAASNALRQQRFVREVTIQYNLCNEPWIKYSISIVADKGLKKPLYTSARLKKGEVLYLETHSCRYELCFNGEKIAKATSTSHVHEGVTDKSLNHHTHTTNGERSGGDNTIIDVFRWSRCKKPLPQIIMHSVGIPLPLEHVEVLHDNIDWEDIQWSQTGVWIAGKEYPLARVHFLSSS